jgi:hypothetical protein
VGRVFTLSPGIIALAKNAISDLIDQLGKPCRLVYPPKMEPCVNCVFDSVGQKSSGRWVTGGPMPFPEGGKCPLCDEQGMLATEYTADIKMLIAWTPREFFLPPAPGVQIPAGTIQAKTYIEHLPKIQQAREMVVQPHLEKLARWRFVLDCEPADVGNIVQDSFVVSQWKRAG